MPVIQVKIVEGVFSKAQKQDMIKRFTDAWVAIEGEQGREYTWVLIEEVKDGHIGIAGKPITVAAAKALTTKGVRLT